MLFQILIFICVLIIVVSVFCCVVLSVCSMLSSWRIKILTMKNKEINKYNEEIRGHTHDTKLIKLT